MTTLTLKETSLRQSNLFTSLFLDYIEKKKGVEDLYSFSPDKAGIDSFIQHNINYNTIVYL